ncbi:MAG TPA: hypothetical protein VFX49_01090 [Chloroflexota bacterium]|nr:hypothetical protein [Chloroflexota bacterium]
MARTPRLSAALYALLLVGAMGLGFYYRSAYLASLPDHALPLSSDAQSYYDEALELRQRVAAGASPLGLFFGGATWFREPLYVFLLSAWLALTGPGESNAVHLSLGASLAWLAVAGLAAGALLGRATGALTAYLLALDSVWIRNSTNGLREEVTGLFLTAAVAALWLPPLRRAAWVWLAPLCVAAAGLTRLDALPFGVFALAWTARFQRWSLTRILACAAVLFLVLVAVFQGYARSRGDAFPSSSIIATANWREEFKDRMGQPGFEWERRVTPAEYLFRYHSPPVLAWYTARGVYRIFAKETFQSLYYAVAGGSVRLLGGAGRYLGLESPYLAPLIFTAGVVDLLRRRSRWRTHLLPIALCFVGVLPPIGFIAGVPQDWLYQVRYGYMAAPFANAILAWAVVGGAAFILARFGRPARARLRPVAAA